VWPGGHTLGSSDPRWGRSTPNWAHKLGGNPPNTFWDTPNHRMQVVFLVYGVDALHKDWMVHMIKNLHHQVNQHHTNKSRTGGPCIPPEGRTHRPMEGLDRSVDHPNMATAFLHGSMQRSTPPFISHQWLHVGLIQGLLFISHGSMGPCLKTINRRVPPHSQHATEEALHLSQNVVLVSRVSIVGVRVSNSSLQGGLVWFLYSFLFL
jgi:hypothetical protein